MLEDSFFNAWVDLRALDSIIEILGSFIKQGVYHWKSPEIPKVCERKRIWINFSVKLNWKNLYQRHILVYVQFEMCLLENIFQTFGAPVVFPPLFTEYLHYWALVGMFYIFHTYNVYVRWWKKNLGRCIDQNWISNFVLSTMLFSFF